MKRNGETAKGPLRARAGVREKEKKGDLESSTWLHLHAQVRGACGGEGENTVIGAYHRAHGFPTGMGRVNLPAGNLLNGSKTKSPSSCACWLSGRIHPLWTMNVCTQLHTVKQRCQQSWKKSQKRFINLILNQCPIPCTTLNTFTNQ